MWLVLLVAVYSLLVLLASLLGGWLPTVLHLTHTRMQLTMSFVGGLMLGVAVLHLLPHAAVQSGSLNTAVTGTLAGLIIMFLVIRLFHVHAHGAIEGDDVAHQHAHSYTHQHACEHEHHGHDHPHAHEISLPSELDHRETDPTVFDATDCHRSPLSWITLAVGLSLHTLIDGMAMAASVAIEWEHAHAGILAGLGTFLAVLLHKPLDSLSIMSVMAAGGWTGKWKHLVNIGFALICPIGFLVFLFGMRGQSASNSPLLGYMLAFAAGAFICIALSDLLPEVQFHSHDRIKLSIALLVGVFLAYAIGFLESEHQHEFRPAGDSPQTHSHDHNHEH